MKLFLIITFLISISSFATANIITNTYYAEADAYTNQFINNFGNATILSAGISSGRQSGPVRTYITFDFSDIPPNAVITLASLSLKCSSGSTSSTTELVVERLTESWGEYTITNSNSPAYTTVGAVSTCTNFFGFKRWDLKAQVQEMVQHTTTNFGWRIRYYNEAQTTSNIYTFPSREASADVPRLTIQYYIPLDVNSASFSHCSTLNSSDGSIEPTFENGTGGTYSYTWYDAFGNTWTGASLSNVPYGWYGLHASDAVYGDEMYMAFIVGVKCEAVEIQFNPGPDYMDDALTSGNTPTNNYGSYQYFSATRTTLTNPSQSYNQRSWIRSKLWLDNTFDVVSAELFLDGYVHNTSQRNNAARLDLVTGFWNETTICTNLEPATTNSVTSLIPSTILGQTNGTENRTVDVTDFWNFWKTDNTQNYGYCFQLQSYADPSAAMRFQSSERSIVSERPTTNFILSLENLPDCRINYAKLKRELDAAYYPVKKGILKFQYFEEYNDVDNELDYRIVNISNNTSISLSNLAVPYGDGRYDLDVNALSQGFYILEVTNQKGEVFKLRFKI